MIPMLRVRGGQRPSPQAMTLGQHLAELRRRVVICVVALAAAGVLGFLGYPAILHLLQAPYCTVSHDCRLYVTGPLDGLSLRVKVATYSAFLLASPVLLWELWGFVTPALHHHERRYAVGFLVSSLLLFSGGIVLAYTSFPHALAFLGSIGGPSLHQLYGPNQYLGLLLALMGVFGLSFEFPVVLVALELAGVLSPAALARARRWAIVAIVVVAAVITPSGDPFSMLALAVPLYLFYELSIAVGRLLTRSRR